MGLEQGLSEKFPGPSLSTVHLCHVYHSKVVLFFTAGGHTDHGPWRHFLKGTPKTRLLQSFFVTRDSVASGTLYRVIGRSDLGQINNSVKNSSFTKYPGSDVFTTKS